MDLVGARHATSKCSTLKDLGRITTCGFHGEDMLFIDLVSHPQNQDAANCAIFKGGERIFYSPSSESPRYSYGTTVSVRGLLYKASVSKNDQEVDKVKKAIKTTALATPRVSFIAIDTAKDAKVMICRKVDTLMEWITASMASGDDGDMDGGPSGSVAGPPPRPMKAQVTRSGNHILHTRRRRRRNQITAITAKDGTRRCFVATDRCVVDKTLTQDLIKDTISLAEESRYSSHRERLRPENTLDGTPDRLRCMSGCPRGILEIVKSKACRSAIMFDQELSQRQCEELIRNLGLCTFPFQCAHGRPSTVPLAIWDQDVEQDEQQDQHQGRKRRQQRIQVTLQHRFGITLLQD
ncbi:hypothetical protein B0O80DRAFT_531963 [Mortierella sp. GBAus27b]|nr:hypothetical protein B0O80DRAFT_531963 [Mortierella sp. GBAus27b]